MKKIVISCFAVVLPVLACSLARAHEFEVTANGCTVTPSDTGNGKTFGDIYTECGLGAMIAPNNHTIAAITNITSDSGATAITSNISSPGNCFGGEGKVASLINNAYELLEADLAGGNGKYLDTLAALAVREPLARQQFKEALRKDFAKAVTASDYTGKTRFEKEQMLYGLVYKNS